MFDFNKYDDATEIYRYEGFIDKNGYFYKVCKRGEKITDDKGRVRDSHNLWAKAFLKEKMNIENFKFNPSASALLTLASLNGPAEVLIHCFGFVYYSHEPVYFKPLIKTPNPKIANYKKTADQLNMLFTIMTLNNEDTNADILFEEDVYDYYGSEQPKNISKEKILKK